MLKSLNKFGMNYNDIKLEVLFDIRDLLEKIHNDKEC